MKTYLIPQSVKAINNKLQKSGFAGLSFRDMQLMAALGKAGFISDNLVQWYQGAYGIVRASGNAVTKWLNLAPSRITIGKNLEQVTAANMPVWLNHGGGAGGNYGYLNGVVSNYFSVPTSSALDITGAIDVRVYVSSPNWYLASQVLVDRAGSGTGYSFLVTSAGLMRFGTTSWGVNSSSPGLINGQPIWLRVTSSASGGTVSFFTSTDGVNWVTCGTAADGGRATNAIALSIGQSVAAASPLTGNLHRAQIYNGIAGTLAFDFNPATYTSGTTFTDSSANAATITLNGGATIVQAPSLYFDGVNDYLKTGAFTLAQPTTVYFVGSQLTWTSGEAFWAGHINGSGVLFQDTTTPGISVYAGTTATAVNSGLALATNGIVAGVVNGTSSSTRVNRGAATTGGSGNAAPNGFTLGANGSGATGWSNITVREVLVFNIVHNAAQQNAVIGYLMEKYGIA